LDWQASIQALGTDATKVNLLFSSASYIEHDLQANGTYGPWYSIGGASNGVGHGQALAAVDPGAYQDTSSKLYNEDWWGVIGAHELGHSMGINGHLPTLFYTMCCSGAVSPFCLICGQTPAFFGLERTLTKIPSPFQ